MKKGELPCAYVQLNDGENSTGINFICENKIAEMAALQNILNYEDTITAVGKILSLI